MGESASAVHVSNWWYGVVAAAAAYVCFVPFLWVVEFVPESATLVSGGVLVGVYALVSTTVGLLALVVLVPVFAVSMFLDHRRVRGSDATDWQPRRPVWTAVAAAYPVFALLPEPTRSVGMSVCLACGLGYLWRRHRRVGRP